MTKYKLVDTFTGWEGTSLYDSLEAAQEALEAEEDAYYESDTIVSNNAIFNKTIAPTEGMS